MFHKVCGRNYHRVLLFSQRKLIIGRTQHCHEEKKNVNDDSVTKLQPLPPSQGNVRRADNLPTHRSRRTEQLSGFFEVYRKNIVDTLCSSRRAIRAMTVHPKFRAVLPP